MFRQRITQFARTAVVPRIAKPMSRGFVACRPLPRQSSMVLKTMKPFWVHPKQITSIVRSTNELQVTVYTVSKTYIFEFDDKREQEQFTNNLINYVKDWPVYEEVDWEEKYDVDEDDDHVDRLYREYLEGKYDVDEDIDEFDDAIDRAYKEYLEGKYDRD